MKSILAFLFGGRGPRGTAKGRSTTRDVAIGYRMAGGFAGDVTRTHPVSIEPCLIDASAPPTEYGQAVLLDPTTQGVRPLTVGDDTATDIYGITVRAFPTQQSSGTNFGAVALGSQVAPPTSGEIDVLKSGYISAVLSGSTAAVKGGSVYVWVTASAGAQVQGHFTAAASAGNTMKLAKAYFNGPADANGIVEIAFNL